MQVFHLNSGRRTEIKRLDGYSTKEQGNDKMRPVFLLKLSVPNKYTNSV